MSAPRPEVMDDAYALAEEVWQDECSISELELMQQVISSDWLKAHVAERVETALREMRRLAVRAYPKGLVPTSQVVADLNERINNYRKADQ